MENKPTQVIIVMTDSTRWDMLNCYRNTGLETPYLDKMANRGTRFERAYTCQPVCGPARSCIFTGQYPHAVGGWSNGMSLGYNVRTIGMRLSDRGIHTAYVGKWHLDGTDYFGLGKAAPGWDKDCWYDMRNYLEELPEELRRSSRKNQQQHPQELKKEDLFAHRVSNHAVDFLSKHGDEDFLLVASYDEPHDPGICPQEYWKKYQAKNFGFPVSPNVFDDMKNKPDYQRLWGANMKQYIEALPKDNLRLPIYGMAGVNEFVDSEIGRVLEARDEFSPNAIVIYTSDHGELLFSHGLVAKGPAFYDECARIPFLMMGPGIKENFVDHNPVSHINITPTILDLFGIKIPPIVSGKSLLPELKDPSVRVNDKIFTEFGRYENDQDGFGGLQLMRSTFDGRYKLSINLLSTDELYDIQEDPGEMINLINDEKYAKIRNELHDAILDNMNKTVDPFRGYCWENRSWRKDVRKPSWAYTGLKRSKEEDSMYAPKELDYSTGMPVDGLVREDRGI